jgi:hypothetical protein
MGLVGSEVQLGSKEEKWQRDCAAKVKQRDKNKQK